MNTSEKVIVPSKKLKDFVQSILEFHGLPSEDAAITADHLVVSNLRGVDTHGVIRLSGYVQRIQAGGNNPQPSISVLSETPSTAVMDGDNSLGQVGGFRAMELAIQKAEQTGLGIVAMRNSNHYGMAAYYFMMALPHDMIGISMTNVLGSMAPTGGVEGLWGNNPFSISFPAGNEPPVVFDFATSKSSWGKALLCQQNNDPLPEGCFQDVEGKATLSPEAFLDGGTLLPIAGHKGYGLALSIGILCGLLSGGGFDNKLPHLYKELHQAGGNSFLMAAFKVKGFVPIERFKKRMDDIIRMIRSSRTGPGVPRVYLPGEMEHERQGKQEEQGILLSRSMVSALAELAQAARLEPPYRKAVLGR